MLRRIEDRRMMLSQNDHLCNSCRASTKIRMRWDKRSWANGNCKAENTNVKEKWFLWTPICIEKDCQEQGLNFFGCMLAWDRMYLKQFLSSCFLSRSVWRNKGLMEHHRLTVGEEVLVLHTGSGSGLFHLQKDSESLMISTEQLHKDFIGKNRTGSGNHDGNTFFQIICCDFSPLF